MTPQWNDSPERIADAILAAGRRRAWIVWTPGDAAPRASLPWLEDMARQLAAKPGDYDRHEAIFLEVGPRSGALYAAFLHHTARGQGQGGLRFWPYPDFDAFFDDGLRLARGMGRKSALAGLWWGGGKGVIARATDAAADDPVWRRSLFGEYGRFVSSLDGCYVTAEDAGTTPEDMRVIHEHTRFATCIPEELGGSGNPAPMTAAGVLCAIESALRVLGLGPLEGKTIAMQGAGNVASHMIRGLLDRGVARITASETHAERRAALLDHVGDPRLRVLLVEPGDASILTEPCDVLVPNALGGVLGPKTIPGLETRLVCGAANNILEEDARDGQALADRGISLVPDFIANRMGIVACCDEHAGRVHPDPAVEAQLDPSNPHSIPCVVERVLEESRRSGTAPTAVANAMADAAMREPHPIHGERTRRIIAALIDGAWDTQGIVGA